MTEGLRDALEALEGYLVERTYKGTRGDREALEEYAARIVTAYLSEHPGEFTLLPKDADGQTIHLQDRMSWDNGTFDVHELNLTADGWTTWDELHGYTVHADQCHHVKPDSWERIISDATALGAQMKRRTYQIGDFVERCKKLAGEE